MGKKQEIPEKEHFYVSEVADLMAERLGRNPKTLANLIYARIDRGEYRAIRYEGVLMLERNEARRIVEGARG